MAHMDAVPQDRKAVEDLLTATLPRLRSFLQRRVQPEILKCESLHDLVQSVCREALKDPDRTSFANETVFRSWLCRIALNKLVDRKRTHGSARRGGKAVTESLVDPGAVLASPDRTPVEAAIHAEEHTRLVAALCSLTREEFAVVEMSKFFGMPHQEIARTLGKTTVAVRKMLSRSLAKLASHAVVGSQLVKLPHCPPDVQRFDENDHATRSRPVTSAATETALVRSRCSRQVGHVRSGASAASANSPVARLEQQ